MRIKNRLPIFSTLLLLVTPLYATEDASFDNRIPLTPLNDAYDVSGYMQVTSTRGTSPLTVNGVASASLADEYGEPTTLSYTWLVVDGKTLPTKGTEAEFKFTEPTLHEIQLEVFYDGIPVASGTQYVEVRENSPPIARIDGIPTRLSFGDSVVVNASDSYDPDGDALFFRWLNSDGQVFPPAEEPPQSDPTATLQFRTEGSHTITLTAYDRQNPDEALSDSVYMMVTVGEPTKPNAAFTLDFDRDNLVPTVVRLDASASNDIGDDGEIVSYDWEIIRLADNEVILKQESAVDVQTTITARGYYRVTLLVTDNTGHVSKAEQTFYAKGDDAPVAIAVVEPVTGSLNGQFILDNDAFTFNLDGSRSYDPDDANWEPRCIWYLNGDSNSFHVGCDSFPFTAYQAGTYNITLKITDVDGYASEHHQSVIVEEPLPDNKLPIANIALDSSVAGNYLSTYQGCSVNLSALGSSDEDNAIISYSWDMEYIGEVPDSAAPSIRRASDEFPEFPAVYTEMSRPFNIPLTNVGEYIITLTVEDEQGGRDSEQVRVKVEPLPNIQASISTLSGQVGTPFMLEATQYADVDYVWTVWNSDLKAAFQPSNVSNRVQVSFHPAPNVVLGGIHYVQLAATLNKSGCDEVRILPVHVTSISGNNSSGNISFVLREADNLTCQITGVQTTHSPDFGTVVTTASGRANYGELTVPYDAFSWILGDETGVGQTSPFSDGIKEDTHLKLAVKFTGQSCQTERKITPCFPTLQPDLKIFTTNPLRELTSEFIPVVEGEKTWLRLDASDTKTPILNTRWQYIWTINGEELANRDGQQDFLYDISKTGRYSVALTVKAQNQNGCYSTVYKDIIAKAIPIARISEPVVERAPNGIQIEFNAQASTYSGKPSFTWKSGAFENGQSCSEETCRFVIQKSGQFTMELIVTDSQGLESRSDSKDFRICYPDPKPDIKFFVEALRADGLPSRIRLDSDLSILPGLSGTWDYRWEILDRTDNELEITGEFGEQAYWNVPDGVNAFDHKARLSISLNQALRDEGCVGSINEAIFVKEWKIPREEESPCSEDNPKICNTSESCNKHGGYWENASCNTIPADLPSSIGNGCSDGTSESIYSKVLSIYGGIPICDASAENGSFRNGAKKIGALEFTTNLAVEPDEAIQAVTTIEFGKDDVGESADLYYVVGKEPLAKKCVGLASGESVGFDGGLDTEYVVIDSTGNSTMVSLEKDVSEWIDVLSPRAFSTVTAQDTKSIELPIQSFTEPGIYYLFMGYQVGGHLRYTPMHVTVSVGIDSQNPTCL